MPYTTPEFIMKVVLFNGSRREKGCTYTALNTVAGELNAAGIETEIFFVGGRVLKGKLGRNMAWLLKSIEAGKQAGIAQPVAEKKIYTNFIR